MTGLRRRALLRALVAGPLAGALAGCNLDSTGDGAGETDEPDDTVTASATPPGSPGTIAPAADPTVEPTPTETASTPVGTATPDAPATATGDPTARSPSPTPDSTASPGSTPIETVDASPETRSERARRFVGRLVRGEFDRAHEMLAADLAGRITAVQLHRYWLGLTAQHGAYEETAAVEESSRDGTETTVVPVACAEGDAPVEFAFDGDAISELRFAGEYTPPDYADQSAFTERETTVDAQGCSLPGTLTLPDDDGTENTDADGQAGSVPGVVLVHGSGPADRDQTVGPNEVFRDLAWGLATEGVAVLRYDKRTYACDVPLAEMSIERVVVDDAVRAVETMRGVDRVDPDAVGVVGHSLGGTCTPRIIRRDGDVAAGAMLAANARPITEVSLDQVRHHFRVDGEFTAGERGRVTRLQRAFEQIESGDVPDGQVVEGYPAIWWKTLLDYDQIATAKSVDVPIWLGQGTRDYQVLADGSFDLWRSELSERPETTFELYSGLSHLFHSGSEPSLREEYRFHDNVAGSVVADLADWIASTAA